MPHHLFKQAFCLIAKTEIIKSEVDDANYALFKKSSLQVSGNKMRRMKIKSGENDFENCIIKSFNLRGKKTHKLTNNNNNKKHLLMELFDLL